MKALIFEDDLIVLEIVTEFLEELNFEVDTCIFPALVMEKVKVNTYDLIILDLYTPEMDGFELTYKIKEFDQKIPILGITGSDDYGYSLLRLDDGKKREKIQTILAKPFSFQDFAEIIKIKFPN